MTSMFYIYLLFFMIISRCFSLEYLFLKKYFSLISDVHKYHGTSSVFFLISRNDRHLEEYTLVHSLSRNLSEKGILSLIINYEELDERIKYYRKHIVRPLIVVLLKSMRDVAKFHENTREMNTSYSVWLMIFASDVSKPLCKYCAHPMGNILNLRYDTQMVVACCDDPTIKEWWTVYENRTETANFATWTQNDGLIVLVSRGIYSRRHDVMGTGFRISIIANTELGEKINKVTSSYFDDILLELKRAMNFTITAEIPVESFGSFNPITNNWTGAIGQLAHKEADFGVAEFTMTNSRLNVIDFSLPLLLTRTRLYIKQPDGSEVQWSAYFQAFTFEIWMAIIFLVITSPILFTVIQMKDRNVPSISLVVQNYLCVWGLFCQQGLYQFPIETPLRIASFSILVSGVVVFTAYSASLTSFLTVSSATLSFSTLSGFVDDGSYKLIVIQNSSNYDLFITTMDPILKKMTKLMKPWTELPKTFDQGFEQVCNERVAFYTNSAVKIKTNRNVTCKIVSIKTERMDSLAMAMTAENQYSGVVDYHLQRFKDNGLLNRLKQKYTITENPAETTYDIVSIWGVAPLLSVLAGGIILAAVILFFERMSISLKKYSQRRKSTMYSQSSNAEQTRFTIHGKKTAIILNRHLPVWRGDN